MKVRKVVTATACAAALTAVLLPAGLAFAEGGMDYEGDPWGDAYSPAKPADGATSQPADSSDKPKESIPWTTITNPTCDETEATVPHMPADENKPFATTDMVNGTVKPDPRPISEDTGVYETDINKELDMKYDQLSDYYYSKLVAALGIPSDGVWKPYTMEELQSVIKRERTDAEAEKAWEEAAEKYLAEHNDAAPADSDVVPATDQDETVQPVEVADATPAAEVAAAENSNSAVPQTSDALPFAAGAVALVGSALAVAGLKLRKNL